MRLFIAEKPSVAIDIVKALGGRFEKKDGYFESDTDVVTWCYGHLLKTAEPKDYQPSYEKWTMEDLPLSLYPLRYALIEDKKFHTKKVIALIKQADLIVHAGDPDDEGQLLVEELLEFAGNKKTVKRLLINDNTDVAVKKALTQMKDNRLFQGIYKKALARNAGDLIYGLSMTRAYSVAGREKGYQGVLSVGRVQTPMLGLIVRRYMANQSHTSSFYYTLAGVFSINGHLFKANWKVNENTPQDDNKRLINKEYADTLTEHLKGKTAVIEVAGVQDKETAPPLPFNLVRLQQIMNKQHKLTAAKTLEITQQLREKYKAITYNRSDCSYLSDEQYSEAPQLINALKAIPDFTNLPINPALKSKAFDSSKVTAHTAIIPTANIPDLSTLSEHERLVYLAIAQQYIVQFLPNKYYQEAAVTVLVDNEHFITKARKTIEQGFTILLGKANSEKNDDEGDSSDDSAFDVLKSLSISDHGTCNTVTSTERKTNPPPLFTEATLLAALVRVADFVEDPRIKKLLKDKDADKKDEHGGIGTPATRSAILETLKKRSYIQEEKGKLLPTETGLSFFNILPEDATRPDITALWSEQQAEIEQGTKTVDDFIHELMAQLREQIQRVTVGKIKVEQLTSTSGRTARLSLPCPNCGKEIAIRPKLLACTECEFKIWLTIAGKAITINQAETLIRKGKTATIKGFASKAGKTFNAALVIKDKTSGAVGFEFEKGN